MPSHLSHLAALALFASPLCSPLAQSQEVYSQIVGAIAVDLPPVSDVMVAFPFKHSASFRGAVVSDAGDTITVADNALDAGAFDSKFFLYIEESTDASIEGRRFDIVSNTASAIKVDLDGGSIASLGAGDRVSVRSHWTLGEAFPGGIASVEETEPGVREIEVVVPVKASVGTASVGGGLSPSRIFYFFNDAWREFGKPITASANDAVLEPGASIVIRNNGSVDRQTYVFGEVVTTPLSVAIEQRSGQTVDNFVSLERPIALKLSELNLETSDAFEVSSSDAPEDREDVLLVYAADEGRLSGPVAQYFFNGNWKSVSDTSTNANNVTIEAGMGLAIRKAAGADAVTYWVNNWNLPSAQ